MLTQTDLFIGGQQGYHTYRIPAMIVSARGTLLAFCEGRRHSRSDTGDIDLILKRSFDGGQTWEPTQTVVTEPATTCGNPCPVVDRTTGTIWLPFCKNLADGPESMIRDGKAPRTVWLTHSDDDGATWAEPIEITPAVKKPFWTWYATGPTHGIQLANGRLLIPCDHVAGKLFSRQDPIYSHVIYSDDHGASWHIGGEVEPGTDECAVIETASGSVYVNCRHERGINRRATAWSKDNGDGFDGFAWDQTLIEPVCQASIARLTTEAQHDRNRVLFSNPASINRENMTVRVSYDECRTWSSGKVLHEGPAAYSDLAVCTDMNICCLYERGDESAYEKLTLARFDIDWLTDGADPAVGGSLH